MNLQLRESLAGQDPSLPLAVAALVEIADDSGVAVFGELAVAYRQDHLELLRREKGDAIQQRGVLSVDEVRHHLLTSVLPRLLTANVVESIAPSRHPGSRSRTLSDYAVLEEGIRVVPHVWATLSDSRQQVREELMSLALAALQASEAPVMRQAVEPSGSILEGRGLTKSYRRRKVVDDVDVSLRQGEIVGLLGPNGAGKTTTFYMIVGLIRPDAGRIGIDGKDISGLPMYKRARRGIGYLAQEPSIFRKLTVEDNVRAILETMPLSEADRDERLETLLDELSIKYLRNVPAYKLSGGERRRLEITRALVTSPKFMLLDEPFAGVDPIAVNDIQTIVASLRRRGIGVLITDHNVEQTLDIVDRAYIMFEGRVQVSGTVRELVFNDQVADLYLGPTLTARLRERLGPLALEPELSSGPRGRVLDTFWQGGQ
jgi:lipopolysaccharide export system ATP-binding protein